MEAQSQEMGKDPGKRRAEKEGGKGKKEKNRRTDKRINRYFHFLLQECNRSSEGRRQKGVQEAMLGIFSQKDTVRFPEGFLWGSSTAGHQIEGGNVNSQLYAREQELRERNPAHEISGRACDFWNRWEEDFDLLERLGHRAFRMSAEWSRLEPEEGVHDKEALQRYLKMLESLKQRGIQVFLTLHHFTHPLWFEKKGGFQKRENVDLFLRHLEYLVPRVAPYVDSWNILNEFNNADALSGPYGGEVKANFLAAHARGAAVVRGYSKAPVSSAHALCAWQPENPRDEFDVTRTRLRDWQCNAFFFHAVRTGEILLPYRDAEYMPELKGSCDYWAINYYTRHMITARRADGAGKRHDCCTLRPINMPFYLEEFYPEGLVDLLDTLHDLPVYITENGYCADDDRLRILYLARHFQAMNEAIRKGCDLRGYLCWSFMDNYEWSSFLPRFGLVAVDFDTLERTPRPSAEFYRDVIRSNGFDRELFLKYLPEFKDWKIYPRE